ncbi:MAG: RNA polymerase sigma factor (sigma-70 family) [Saprospiraceae bacterium]
MNHSDEEILRLVRSEETRSYGFNVLTRAYQEKVYWVIRRMVVVHEDSDDLVQEVFMKVWKSVDGFKGESKLYTWVYRIAVNEALTHLRKKKRRFFVPIVDVEAELASHIDDASCFDGDEVEIKLQKAILNLPEKQRLVFNLKYFEEMKYKDMSEILKISEGGLKAQYHHAVKKIKKELAID